MEWKNVKVAVIGGGASGLAAAIACGRKFGAGSTVILERQIRTGRKLLATGNGRCNITNRGVSPKHYYGDREIIDSVLSQFSVEDSEQFFGEMGILFRNDSEGRVYPHSNQATTILDCMRLTCAELGVEEICDITVQSITKRNRAFQIASETLTVAAEYVIVATGSQASPLLGANDSGYRLLMKMGIEPTQLFPALSPISTKERYKNLKGVRAKGKVTLLADGKPLKVRDGEVQFTDYGLSGICVFEISRFVNEFFINKEILRKPYREIQISVDVMSEYAYNDLCAYLTRCKRIFSDGKASELLSAALNKKLSQSIAQYCSLANKPCRALTEHDIKKLAWGAKNFIFTPMIADGYKSAQVSAGGIDVTQVDPNTLMTRKYKNLFVVGELLNVDGDCGGFNLHFAFGSALIPVKYMR